MGIDSLALWVLVEYDKRITDVVYAGLVCVWTWRMGGMGGEGKRGEGEEEREGRRGEGGEERRGRGGEERGGREGGEERGGSDDKCMERGWKRI